MCKRCGLSWSCLRIIESAAADLVGVKKWLFKRVLLADG
ncbi:hypothetical protein VRK_34500 [Vibrio sp. MEBiC08052]|nr:hypothetical protein VRK_34500 [Vibrio sp. MEBiC08052]